jgi:hypothetical protein
VRVNDIVDMFDDDHSQYALQSYADCRDKVMSVTLYLYYVAAGVGLQRNNLAKARSALPGPFVLPAASHPCRAGQSRGADPHHDADTKPQQGPGPIATVAADGTSSMVSEARREAYAPEHAHLTGEVQSQSLVEKPGAEGEPASTLRHV